MIAWMREHRPEVAEGRVMPVLSDETHLPLDDGLADLVVMVNLHHELADPASTYAEARRVLRPGGQVLLVDWAPIETPKGPPQQVRASAEELAGLLSAAGFVDVTVHPPLPWHSMLTARVPRDDDPEEARARAAFLASHPGYGDAVRLDEMRETEYGRLDRLGHVYLDYTGGGLYAVSQLRRHLELLADDVLGQPALAQSDVACEHAARRRGACRGARVLPRVAAGIRRRLHVEREWRPEARGRVVSVRSRRPLPAHATTTTTRSTGYVSSPAAGAPR